MSSLLVTRRETRSLSVHNGKNCNWKSFFFSSLLPPFPLSLPLSALFEKKRVTLVSLKVSIGHLTTRVTLATRRLIHLPCHFRPLILSLVHLPLLITTHLMVIVIWIILCLTHQMISPAMIWATVALLTINPVILTLTLTIITMMTQMIKTDPLTGIGFDRWYQIFTSSLALPLSPSFFLSFSSFLSISLSVFSLPLYFTLNMSLTLFCFLFFHRRGF